MSPNHWIIVPVVLPLMTAALLLLLAPRAPRLTAQLSVISSFALLLTCLGLLAQADAGPVQSYLVSNWKAPFGIALALDRLAALMLVLTAAVALAALIYSRGGDDQRGPHFHALFQFQLMGLNGAFLTSDLFNLFVFFEVLLIASYGLLLHGAGLLRLRASVHYISFNLAGAALFLISVSLLYGLTGTLNMADLARRIAHVPADRTQLVQSAAMLLMVVFLVKAALLPLYFWLPNTYGSACAPAAAIFALLTKVGVYAVLRVSTLIFGEAAGPAALIVAGWLPILALATIVTAAIGAMAVKALRIQIGYLVIGSAGTLLFSVGIATPASVAAGLFYMVNSTLAVAALYLLADRIIAARADAQDQLRPAAFDASRTRLAVLFMVFAIAIAGMPPLAGFLGKALLLQSTADTGWSIAAVAVVLSTSLLVIIALARAGSTLFWSPAAQGSARLVSERTGPSHAVTVVASGRAHRVALALLLSGILATSLGAGPLSRYTQATSMQLFERQSYLNAVLNGKPVPAAIDVRRELRERKANKP